MKKINFLLISSLIIPIYLTAGNISDNNWFDRNLNYYLPKIDTQIKNTNTEIENFETKNEKLKESKKTNIDDNTSLTSEDKDLLTNFYTKIQEFNTKKLTILKKELFIKEDGKEFVSINSSSGVNITDNITISNPDFYIKTTDWPNGKIPKEQKEIVSVNGKEYEILPNINIKSNSTNSSVISRQFRNTEDLINFYNEQLIELNELSLELSNTIKELNDKKIQYNTEKTGLKQDIDNRYKALNAIKTCVSPEVCDENGEADTAAIAAAQRIIDSANRRIAKIDAFTSNLDIREIDKRINLLSQEKTNINNNIDNLEKSIVGLEQMSFYYSFLTTYQNLFLEDKVFNIFGNPNALLEIYNGECLNIFDVDEDGNPKSNLDTTYASFYKTEYQHRCYMTQMRYYFAEEFNDLLLATQFSFGEFLTNEMNKDVLEGLTVPRKQNFDDFLREFGKMNEEGQYNITFEEGQYNMTFKTIDFEEKEIYSFRINKDWKNMCFDAKLNGCQSGELLQTIIQVENIFSIQLLYHELTQNIKYYPYREEKGFNLEELVFGTETLTDKKDNYNSFFSVFVDQVFTNSYNYPYETLVSFLLDDWEVARGHSSSSPVASHEYKYSSSFGSNTLNSDLSNSRFYNQSHLDNFRKELRKSIKQLVDVALIYEYEKNEGKELTMEEIKKIFEVDSSNDFLNSTKSQEFIEDALSTPSSSEEANNEEWTPPNIDDEYGDKGFGEDINDPGYIRPDIITNNPEVLDPTPYNPENKDLEFKYNNTLKTYTLPDGLGYTTPTEKNTKLSNLKNLKEITEEPSQIEAGKNLPQNPVIFNPSMPERTTIGY